MASRPSLPFKLSDKLDAPPPAVVMKEDDPHLLSPAIPEGEVLLFFCHKKNRKKRRRKEKKLFRAKLASMAMPTRVEMRVQKESRNGE